MNKKRIAVLFGGRSGEHLVSVTSAASLIKYLSQDKYELLPIYITIEGKWLYPVLPQTVLDNSFDIKEAREVAILPDPTKKGLFSLTDGVEHLIDVVFPVMHGTYAEDGTIQGLLELAGIPYVGAGVLASAVGMDKAMMKAVFAYHHIPQVNFKTVWRDSLKGKKLDNVLTNIENELGYPCFVKPANLGSSVGINKAKNKEELITALMEAAEYDQKLVVEEYVEAREIEVSILGNQDPKASVAGEIIPGNEFYDYQAKYIDDNSLLIIPAKLSEEESQLICQLAIKAYQAIDCTGLARVDFFITKKEKRVLINEINTLPGFTKISMYPKLWEETGIKYVELLDFLITLAEERYQEKLQNKVEFKAT